MRTLEVRDRAAWRAWLAANHDKEAEVWLVYFKKATGIPCVSYNDSVEEALCFGWVDSLIKKLDEDRYARKFTPRKPGSRWSPSNIERVERLISQGRMADAGLRKVEAARQSGEWANPVQKPQLTHEMPPEFAEALKKDSRAQENFFALAPTYQRQYLGWIEVAKRPETKEKRIKEAVELLAKGEKLGLR
jgi:uncharacterized protein YdeI (YjbR/CyaY-like superfamily)